MGDLSLSKSFHEKLPTRGSDTIYQFPDNNYPGNLNISDLSSDERRIFEMPLPLEDFVYIQDTSGGGRKYTPFMQSMIDVSDIDSSVVSRVKTFVHAYVLTCVRAANISQDFFLSHGNDFSFENLLGDEQGGRQSTNFVFHDLWARTKILEFIIMRTLFAEQMNRERMSRNPQHLTIEQQLELQTPADFCRILAMHRHQVSAANNKLRICIAHRHRTLDPQSLTTLFPNQVKALRDAHYQLVARVEKFFQQCPSVAAIPQFSSILSECRNDLSQFERISGSASDSDLVVSVDVRFAPLLELLFAHL